MLLLVIKVIGLLVAAGGVVFLVQPEKFEKVLSYFKEGKKIYLGSAIKAACGLVFIIARSQCEVPQFIVMVGVLSLLGGIAGFVLKPEKTVKMLDWFSSRPPKTKRMLGIIYIAFGILIIFAA